MGSVMTVENAPGSDHYKVCGIEPIEYIEANNLSFHEGNVVKYVTRWRRKGGVTDLEKARFYLDRLIEVAKKEGLTSV